MTDIRIRFQRVKESRFLIICRTAVWLRLPVEPIMQDSKFSGTNVYGENILAGGENQRLFQDGYMFTARGGLMGVINVVSNYMGRY